jgi:RNA polymerase sigma factor (sigma-70 family)
MTGLGRAWARRAGLSQESSDDLVQEALVVVIAKEPRPAKLVAFFFGVLQRLLLKRFRWRYVRGKGASHSSAPANSEVRSIAISADERLDLGIAIEQLPADLRRVLALSEHHGYSADEIARGEGIDRQEVYHRKRRAVRALRQTLR